MEVAGLILIMILNAFRFLQQPTLTQSFSGLGCKEEKLFNLALREEEFVFSETAAGETLIIPCDAT